ncbi:MAG: hypothetical protein WCG94_09185, partial [Methanothrix sp.]
MSQALRSVSTELTAPVSAAFTSSGNSLSNFFTNLFAIGSLREEKQALQAQVLRLEQQSSDLEALKRENSSLKLELKVQGVARELPKQLGK